MYVFILDRSYDSLLDMSFEEAEQYAIRRLISCGVTPCYRHFYEGIKDEFNDISHFVEYGTRYDGKYSITSRLKCVTPRTADEYIVPGDREEQLAIWKAFIFNAKNSKDHYYEIE